MIKVKYKVLEPVLDFHEAKDNAVCIHPEDNWESRFPVGADNKRNLCRPRGGGHRRCGADPGRLRLCGGADISHKGQPAGNDGDLPQLYLHGTILEG